MSDHVSMSVCYNRDETFVDMLDVPYDTVWCDLEAMVRISALFFVDNSVVFLLKKSAVFRKNGTTIWVFLGRFVVFNAFDVIAAVNPFIELLIY